MTVTVVSAGLVVGLRNCSVSAPAGSASKEKRPSSPVTARAAPATTVTPGIGTRSPLRSTIPSSGAVGPAAAAGAAAGCGWGGGFGAKWYTYVIRTGTGLPAASPGSNVNWRAAATAA